MLPEGLVEIGREAFRRTPISAVEFPSALRVIGELAFEQCKKLTAVSIPDQVTTIGKCCFEGCEAMETLYIGAGVETVPESCFASCTALREVFIAEGVRVLDGESFFNCPSLSKVVIPKSMEDLGAAFTSGFPNMKTAGPIGGGYNIEFGWTEKIPDDAFHSNFPLESVVLPDGLIEIGDSAFYGQKKLTAITLPESVQKLETMCFHSCSSLNQINLPAGITEFGEEFFYQCGSLTSIELPEGITTIGPYCFADCTGLESVEIPAAISRINNDAFARCSALTQVTFAANAPVMDRFYVFHHVTATIRYPQCSTGWDEVRQYTYGGTLTWTPYENAHTAVVDEAVEPSCIQTGLTAGSHCGICGKVLEVQQEIPLGDHNYKAAITEPTCTQQGYTTHTCTVCSHSYSDAHTDAAGHQWQEWVVTRPAAPGVPGEQQRQCPGCGDVEIEEIPAIAAISGDINGDGAVDADDAIYLLYHTLFGEDLYPVDQACDFNGSGAVDSDDAIYMLYHTLFGAELYPLN